MPYVLLALGIILGIWGLYKFVINADIQQITALFIVVFLAAVGVGAFVLAMTGRLPAAIGVLVAVLPVIMPLVKKRKKSGGAAEEFFSQKHEQGRAEPLTRKDALQVLGLEEGASDEEIKSSYKKLIKKVHPDQEGSAWMAAKLNEARDLLMGDKKSQER